MTETSLFFRDTISFKVFKPGFSKRPLSPGLLNDYETPRLRIVSQWSPPCNF